ncbi:hypothetical protein [uncultured Chitinophaga sp.]|uniref:hypothetical protein n=1 Tax=uncultured Chitinophaga sp. TaxID=339340 RepID=UPI00260F9F86|nr:hypothetical protein [uncultured Chitinophaga sp.]
MIMNELSNVEKWLTTINPDQLISLPVDQPQLKEELAWLAAESYRIKGDFQTRFHDYKVRHAHDYIRKNQMSLLRLLDQIEDFLQQAATANVPELMAFYEDVYLHVEKILLHLTRYYSAVIDDSLPMPARYTAHKRAKLLPDYEQLLQLYEHPGIQKPLLDVVFRPLKAFFQRDSLVFTFQQCNYFKIFMGELLSLLDVAARFTTEPGPQPVNGNGYTAVNGEHLNGEDFPEMDDLNWQLHYKLHFLNFNNLEYRNFCTRQLHTKLEAMSSLAKKVERVNWYISTERRQHTKPGVALEPGLPVISEQILRVIEEEYKYLLEQDNLLSPKQARPYENGFTKLKLRLTSLELAQFAAACEEAGMLEGKKVDIINYLARNFISENGEELQESSLRTQYYATRHNPAAYQRLIDWLQKVQDILAVKINKTALTIFWVITGNCFWW